MEKIYINDKAVAKLYKDNTLVFGDDWNPPRFKLDLSELNREDSDRWSTGTLTNVEYDDETYCVSKDGDEYIAEKYCHCGCGYQEAVKWDRDPVKALVKVLASCY
jgi:hypothetical protein|tara:strand:- start:236 stop:550 length:315 start_codon:yes stop_codon:yes gene_type:complete